MITLTITSCWGNEVKRMAVPVRDSHIKKDGMFFVPIRS